MTRVVIHPSVEIDWCSYFVEGLIRLYGYKSIRYRTDGFPDIEDRTHMAESGYMHFRIEGGGRPLRVVIDPMDTSEFLEPSLEWCDIYGKVNLDPQNLPRRHADKVVSCAPHFPVRNFRLPLMAVDALRTYRRGLRSPLGHFKKHIYRPFKYHRPLASWVPGEPQRGYVFMNSSLWKTNRDTNDLRAMFMDACQSLPNVRFEGGFLGRPDVADYKHLRSQRRFGVEKYRKKVGASLVVFTNPSVLGAHSFRLGEYLALGKAILTPRLTRVVVRPLVHGEHVHFIEPNYDSIHAGIEHVVTDEAYRRKLERGARSYFDTVCNPTTLMRDLIQRSSLYQYE